MTAKHSKNFILLFITAIIWGVAFVAQSVGMDYVGPYTFNAVRCLFGWNCAYSLRIFMFVPEKRMWKNPVVRKKKSSGQTQRLTNRRTTLPDLMIFISTTLQQVGIAYTTVAKAGFITALYIVLVPVLGIFIKKKIGLKSMD